MLQRIQVDRLFVRGAYLEDKGKYRLEGWIYCQKAVLVREYGRQERKKER